MRTTTRRISLIAAVLLLLAMVVPAQAVEYLCGDICQCWVGCTRRCTDDTSGFSTTCGAAGYPCSGQCFAAAIQAAEPQAIVMPQASSDTCGGTTLTPESILDAAAQP